MSRIAAVEIRVPTGDVGDERRRGQQRAIGLSGLHLDTRRRAGQVCKVEGVGGEGAVGAGGDGGDLVGGVGGSDVEVGFEEFGAAAVVEVEGGEDDVDAGGLPVGGGIGFQSMMFFNNCAGTESRNIHCQASWGSYDWWVGESGKTRRVRGCGLPVEKGHGLTIRQMWPPRRLIMPKLAS